MAHDPLPRLTEPWVGSVQVQDLAITGQLSELGPELHHLWRTEQAQPLGNRISSEIGLQRKLAVQCQLHVGTVYRGLVCHATRPETGALVVGPAPDRRLWTG